MAKEAKAKSATSKSEGGGGSLIWLQGLACGGMAAIAPMAVLQIALLLAPGLLSLLTERQAGKPVTRSMLLFGLAASVEPIRQAWALGGPTWDRAADGNAIIFAWAAAAFGWLLARGLPVLVGVSVSASHDSRAVMLREAREELVRAWGLEEEAGSAPEAQADPQ